MTGPGESTTGAATTGPATTGPGAPSAAQAALAATAGDVVAALTQRLPEVLALPRFAAGAEALVRLADPRHREASAAACTDGEAARLGEVLAARWAALVAATGGTAGD